MCDTLYCFLYTSFTRNPVPKIRVLYRARARVHDDRIRRFPVRAAPHAQVNQTLYIRRYSYLTGTVGQQGVS